MPQTRDWQNIGRKLPLLVTVLLLIAVSAISWTAYYAMKRATIAGAREHLASVARQVASALGEADTRLRREGSPLGRDSAIVAALSSNNAAALAAAKARLVARIGTNSVVGAELWKLDGTLLLAAGTPVPAPARLTPFEFIVNPLLVFHDSVMTDARIPVLGPRGDTLGILREVARPASAQGKQLLTGLIGGNALFRIGNRDGSVWTDLDQVVEGPDLTDASDGTVNSMSGGERWIGALAPVARTAWVVWVAQPADDILAQAHGFLVIIALVAAAVVLLGTLGATILSRHIIAPLSGVTQAAEAIAGGDYSIRVKPVRRDEVGRLAEAFSTMAGAIERASMDLENQQVELEAQQTELQEANEELRRSVAVATRAREAAERSRGRAAAILSGALDAIITVDERDEILEFNPAAAKLFGRTAQEASGRPIADLIQDPGGDAPAAGARFPRPSGEVRGQRVESQGIRPDGTTFPIEVSVSRIPLDDAAIYTYFIRDLSERKQLQAQLQQAQKMEAIGRLAGGVAHDFNNMLTVMISYTDLVLSNREIAAETRTDLTQVRSAADRAAGLTRQLLAFSRKQVLRPTVIDVNEVVGGVITMLARVMPENIRLSTTLGTSLESVFVDRGQLEQVLMNLAVNARDAMPGGGSLTIETANATLDESYAGLHGARKGQHVVLSVRDTGVGMDAATKERIFEPFFTTKPVGQGTGLGLATVYGIVEQSGGSIYVYSEPGLGTIFKVYFPAHGSTAAPADASQAVPSSTGPLRVLVVEDDPAVRDATSVVLRSLGHTVIQAPDVAAGLTTVRAGAERIDVVLTDAVMPGQSGLDLARILLAERPDLPVILMSGYAEETINYDAAKTAGMVFIEKPFTSAVIARALAEVRSSAQIGGSVA